MLCSGRATAATAVATRIGAERLGADYGTTTTFPVACLVALHVPVGRHDLVQAEHTVHVGSVPARLDRVDDLLQRRRARAAFEGVAWNAV